MKHYSLIFSLLFFVVFNTNAQNTSLPTNDDSSKFVKQYLPKKNKLVSLILPCTFIAYGIIAQGNNGLKTLDKSTKATIIQQYNTPITSIDDYLQFTPALAVYGLNAVGIKGKNNFRDRTAVFLMANIIASASALTIKKITKVERPDGSENNSFPSGHTTTTFAAAEFMRQEYKDVSPWYAIAGYAAATATGVLRVYNNKHWVSDVVAGAGFGIISTKLAYWIYPSIKKKIFKNKMANSMAMPYYNNGTAGLVYVYNF